MLTIVRYNPHQKKKKEKRKVTEVLNIFLRMYRGPETKCLITKWTLIELNKHSTKWTLTEFNKQGMYIFTSTHGKGKRKSYT